MTADEFLGRAASQAPVEAELDVSIPGPEVIALLARNIPVRLEEIVNHPDRRIERRTLRYGHLVEPGVSQTDLERWQQQHSGYVLPDDLRRFLLRANGIQLWANLDSRHSSFRLLPLEQWTDAAFAWFAYVFKTVPTAGLVLSDADDGDGFVVLDTLGPRYYWCDPISGPETIGSTIDELLTYWWDHCAIKP